MTLAIRKRQMIQSNSQINVAKHLWKESQTEFPNRQETLRKSKHIATTYNNYVVSNAVESNRTVSRSK